LISSDIARVSAADPLPLVLVPGACLGGWCWRGVATRLRAFGHEVHPVTLTGLGERVHLADRAVDIEMHVMDVVNVLDFEDLRDVVLVGHSYAGTVITGAADRRPDRLAVLVYLDTSPLPGGVAIVDVQSEQQRAGQRRSVDEDGEGWRWPAPTREAIAAGTFGSASGLGEAEYELLERRATPQPYATFTTPLRLTRQPSAGIRHVAIFCAEGGISVAQLRALMARNDPRTACFRDRQWEFAELGTGHWPMLSAPGPLAELLHGVAAGST
jgi:pimeloyl-ACP methyl ester carboxylesterase